MCETDIGNKMYPLPQCTLLCMLIIYCRHVCNVASGRALAGMAGSDPAGGVDVCCECCALSGTDLCVGLVTGPEESYGVWCTQ
jgi:hypothetical protein